MGFNRKLHAVIVGINYANNSSSDIKKLDCPVREAGELYELLCENFSDYRSNFVLMTDDVDEDRYQPTYANMKRELGQELPRKVKKEDFVIVYFSGHGTPEYRYGEELPARYLVPIDVDKNNIYGTCYDLENDFITFLTNRGLEASGILVILDCCFSGGVGGKTFSGPQYQEKIKGTKILSQKFSELNLGKGWQIITACESNEEAYEGDRYSILTQAFIDTITGNVSNSSVITEEDGVEVITTGAIYDEICTKVASLRPEQHPNSIGSISGLKFPILKKK